MKKLSSLIFLVTISCACSMAQSSRVVRVKAGEDVAQAYSSHGFYRFPEFSKAILYYKGGGQNSSPAFNYNLLSGNLQFIGPKKDTLELVGQEQVDSVAFENTLIYNGGENGLLEVLSRSDSALLLKRIIIKTQFENIGAYGQANATGSIDNVRTYLAPSGVFNLIFNQDVVVSEKTYYYFMGKNKKLVKATRSNLYTVLSPKGIRKAEAYFSKNDVNYNKEEDLIKLMDAVSNRQ